MRVVGTTVSNLTMSSGQANTDLGQGYTYSMLIAAEISAASVVIEYWTEKVPVAVWITIILVLIVTLNIFVVSIYGESEFC